MVELAIRYIEKRIEQTRTGPSDNIAKAVFRSSSKTKAKLAWEEAHGGSRKVTASHLRGADLYLSQKGHILSHAYTRSAESYDRLAENFYSSPNLQTIYQKEAKRSRRIAKGLRRASFRLDLNGVRMWLRLP